MILQKQEWNKCDKCGQRTDVKQYEKHGCDCCGKHIDLQNDKYGNKFSPHLDLQIFYHEFDKVDDLIFCSWKCVFEIVKKYKDNKDINFICFPAIVIERDIKDEYCGNFFDYLYKRSHRTR